VVDLLNRTNRVKVYGELFISRRKPRAERLMTSDTAEYLDANLRDYPLFCEMARPGLTMRPARTFAYLNQLYGRAGATGFKLMYSNIVRFPEIWAYVVWHHLPVLHLVRMNHLDFYISWQIRQVTRTVHSLAGELESPGGQIELNISDLFRSMRRARRNIQIAQALLRVSHVPHLEIQYESLLGKRQSLEAICDFLHLAPGDPQRGSKLRKLVTGSHDQVIKNYDEVRQALQGTDFDGLL
jgi:hypothetical protein